MKTPAILITTMFLNAAIATAAEGISPAWTEVAEADQTLMGDYEGEWIDAPKGHYFDINKPLAAQVINIRESEYQLRFFQQHDSRADPYSAAVWKDGKKISPPRITVRHNGVLIHNDAVIPHGTSHTFAGRTSEPRGDGPLRLQDHGNALQFRNIWVLPVKKD